MSYKLPRNSDGWVEPHDHPHVEDDHGVIRKVSSFYVVDDPKVEGGKRISTGLMSGSTSGSKGMSVDLQNMIEVAGVDPYIFVTTPKWIGSVRLVAKDVRNLDFMVGQDPIDGNDYHGEVWGTFSRARQKSLLRHSEWFVEIDGVKLCAD